MVIATLKGEVFYKGKRYSREVWETALMDVKKEMRRGGLVDKESRDAVNRYEKGDISSGRSSISIWFFFFPNLNSGVFPKSAASRLLVFSNKEIAIMGMIQSFANKAFNAVKEVAVKAYEGGKSLWSVA